MNKLDDLTRYVAGPLSLASLGVAFWGVDLTAAAFVAGAVAAVWAAAALIVWWSQRFSLKGRAIHLANRVRRCVPGWWKHPDFEPMSVYGNEVSAAQHLEGMQKLEGKRVRPFWTRRYSDRLYRKVTRVIEDMGRAGVIENNLKPYLTERLPASQYDNFARDLWWAACKLP